MILLLWFFILIIVLVIYNRDIHSRFKKYDVKHFTPLPIIGNIGELVLQKKHLTEQLDDLYYKFREERFVGRYIFTKPLIMIQDIELVKKITVKDFEHFLDHGALAPYDPLLGRNLVSLAGQEWKDMRSTLSPAFTSSKIGSMVPFMLEAGDMMMQTLKDKIILSGVDYVDVNCKELTTRYTNDVIASCAFGLKVNSHKEDNNEFYNAGKEIATLGARNALFIFGYKVFPKLMKYLGLKMISDSKSNFFRRIILDTMKERESQNIIRPDMIHLLMEAKKGKLSYDGKQNEADAGFATVEESHIGLKHVHRDWSDDDLVAQAVLFFVAGFDTVATAMTFLLYELAVNPDVQDRLAQEIKEHDIKTGGKFDYNSIQNMKYIDMVVSETLRLWPPAVCTNRLCVKNYNLGKPNRKSTKEYIIHKGEAVLIPIFSFHRDPVFFPEPEKFNPERFSDQNKHTIKSSTYAPFGFGARNCIGSRFALCEIKVMIYQLLQQMQVCPYEKTQIPAKLLKGTYDLKIEGGHWVRLKIRQ